MTSLIWVFQCESKEILQKAREFALEKIDLNRVYTDAAISFPGGVERREVYSHKMSDYFKWIKIGEVPDNCFSLEFRQFPDSVTKGYLHPRFWKDLAVEVISSIAKLDGVSFKHTKKIEVSHEDEDEII